MLQLFVNERNQLQNSVRGQMQPAIRWTYYADRIRAILASCTTRSYNNVIIPDMRVNYFFVYSHSLLLHRHFRLFLNRSSRVYTVMLSLCNVLTIRQWAKFSPLPLCPYPLYPSLLESNYKNGSSPFRFAYSNHYSDPSSPVSRGLEYPSFGFTKTNPSATPAATEADVAITANKKFSRIASTANASTMKMPGAAAAAG